MRQVNPKKTFTFTLSTLTFSAHFKRKCEKIHREEKAKNVSFFKITLHLFGNEGRKILKIGIWI